MLTAIRGATTVAADTPEEIRGAVRELLEAICHKNRLREDDVVCILFSNTSDIRSLYPAKAAREAGFARAALFSAAEPEIDGALPLCIRLMVLTEGDGRPVHVYLRAAASLRRDRVHFSVALDGENAGADIVSRSVAAQSSQQELYLRIDGNKKCHGHSECDAIIMDDAKVLAIPALAANNVDAELIHEAAIGKIAGEQLLKLMTLGLTEQEAEEQIIKGFLS